MKGRLGKDAKVLANKNNELAKKNPRVEEGRQYWKQEALEMRAQKKQIEDNKNYWKNEALQSRKEKKKYLDNITYLRFF